MPYIRKEDRIPQHPDGFTVRGDDDCSFKAENAGELNYAVTFVVNDYLARKKLDYAAINEAIGVLECAKLELYRRVAVPYEDNKIRINGDVYSKDLTQ
jgi:hypothetical protein